ncbi:hypothetical protein KSI01_31450 [Kurthia sibirica]|nr:hypothetical protein KSI01_31450 [Kurthia sibirica]
MLATLYRISVDNSTLSRVAVFLWPVVFVLPNDSKQDPNYLELPNFQVVFYRGRQYDWF